MNKNVAKSLIAELKQKPERFVEEGRAYDLLQEYFKGERVDSLADLLASENLSVRKSAVWIVSELARDAISVAEQIVNLLDDDERYVKYYALESLMSFSGAGLTKVFHHLVSALEDDDPVIRELGMFLVSNSSGVQLEEALQFYSEVGKNCHVEGLALLLGAPNGVEQTKIHSLLYGGNNTLAMYSAILIKREIKMNFRKIRFDVNLIDDLVIRNFLDDFV